MFVSILARGGDKEGGGDVLLVPVVAMQDRAVANECYIDRKWGRIRGRASEQQTIAGRNDGLLLPPGGQFPPRISDKNNPTKSHQVPTFSLTPCS
jgi:hypothetical protein